MQDVPLSKQKYSLNFVFYCSLKPATDSYPLALLPVGNKPLLSYQIEYLERNGIYKIIIVVEKRYLSKLEKYFHHYFRPSHESTEVDLVAV